MNETSWIVVLGLSLGLSLAALDGAPQVPAPGPVGDGPSPVMWLALGAREIRPGDSVEQAIEKLGLAELGATEKPPYFDTCGSINLWAVPAEAPVEVCVFGHTSIDDDGDGHIDRLELERPLVWGVQISHAGRSAFIYYRRLSAI